MFKRIPASRSLAFLCCLAIAGCTAQEQQEAAPPPVAPEDLKTVAVTDELGQFETAVSGIALWSHPLLAYKGGVMAANGPAGLIFVDTEAASSATLEGDFSAGVSVSYLGRESLIAAYDAQAQSLRLLNVLYDPLRLADWELASGTEFLPSGRVATCLARRPLENRITLVMISEQGRLTHASVSGNGDSSLTVLNRQRLDTDPLISCTSDDRTGLAYLLSKGGKVIKADFAGEDGTPLLEDFIRLPDLTFTGLAIILQADDQGQLLAVSEGTPGAVYAYDLATGSLTGAFTAGELVDIEAVQSISAFAADGSNFGGIHRDGVMALVEGTDSLKLKLVPWSGIARQLGLPVETGMNRRTLAAPAEENDRPQFELPELGSN